MRSVIMFMVMNSEAHLQRGTRKFRFAAGERRPGALEISLTNDSELNIVDALVITADYDIKNGLATGTLYLKYLSGKYGDALG